MRFIKALYVSFILIVLIVGVCGCMYNDEVFETYKDVTEEINKLSDSTINMVTRSLENKYSCKMTALKIGNRINTEITTIYFCPDNNPDIVFSAVVDVDMNEIKDDFIIKIVAEQVKNKFESVLDSYGINSACNVFVYGENPECETNTEITVDEYVSLYSVNSFFCYMSIDENSIDSDIAEKLTKSVKTISDEYNQTIVVSGFIIGSDFDKCKNDLDINPDVSDAWFYDYDVVSSFKFSVIDGICNISEEELLNKIKR